MSSSPLRRYLIAFATATLLVALAAPAGAAGPPGNNGTVKIHNGDADLGQEPAPEIRNEPHVSGCFHAHFFFGDGGQAGNPTGDDWWIVGHPPGGAGSAHGEYVADPNGEVWTGPISLSPGHYKLYWVGRNGQNIKHKTFWVDSECEGGGGGGGGEPECPDPNNPLCNEG